MGVNFSSKSSAAASPDKLRQLSDDVGRIASTLARMSSGLDSSEPAEKGKLGQCPPEDEVSAEAVKLAIRARRLRSRYFDPELFADPAWDMLLNLYHAQLSQMRVPVSSLCDAAEVPPTTALRWIATMTEAGLFARRSDPIDRRRVFVELTPQASEGMRCYFVELGKTRPQ
ncbi:MAG TPA: winged helix DNA-binding protein [Sphingomicrobium sp.]|nr:winged helix DNA-binding protein [Sphingomicrobium sp.]